jgi:rubrerythrin
MREQLFVYFCLYCGYEFSGRPKLSVECPKCGKTLRSFGEPIITLRINNRRVPL